MRYTRNPIASLSAWLIISLGVAIVGLGCQDDGPTVSHGATSPTNTPLRGAAAGSGSGNTQQPTTAQGYAVAPVADSAADITMVDFFIHPRRVDTDSVWFPLVRQRIDDPDEFSKYLAMWDVANPCYAELETGVAELGEDTWFDPLDFIQYVRITTPGVSTCVQELLPQLDADDFFAYTTAQRERRIERLLNASSDMIRVGDQLVFPECETVINSHLPDLSGATNPMQLRDGFRIAARELFSCFSEQTQIRFPHLEVYELFALPTDERLATIDSQLMAAGHIASLMYEVHFDVCRESYQALFPTIHQAPSPQDLEVAMDGAQGSLFACFERTLEAAQRDEYPYVATPYVQSTHSPSQ